jgi:hypothetical protein
VATELGTLRRLHTPTVGDRGIAFAVARPNPCWEWRTWLAFDWRRPKRLVFSSERAATRGVRAVQEGSRFGPDEQWSSLPGDWRS